MLFSDPLPTVCETCGGPLKKLLSAPAVQFKGSGFYLTDYGRSGSAANPGAKDKDAASVAAEAKSSGDAKAGSEAKSSEGRSSGDGKASGDGKSSGEGKTSGEAKTSGEKSGTSGGTTAGSGGNAKTAG